MKKLLAAVLCIAMILAMTACGNNNKNGSGSNAGQNISAAEQNGQSDQRSDSDENSSPEIETSSLDLNGLDCRYTKAATREDISGLMNDGEPVFKKDSDNTASIEIFINEEYKAARWFNKSMQHCLVVKDDGTLERSEFQSFVTSQQELSLYGMPYSEMLILLEKLEGRYVYEHDEKLATMSITTGDEKIECAIYWPIDEKSSDLWTMTAGLSGDGLFYYEDGLMAEIDFSEDPKGDSEVIMQSMTGCFEVKADGTILWPHGGPDGETAEFTRT